MPDMSLDQITNKMQTLIKEASKAASREINNRLLKRNRLWTRLLAINELKLK
jgi:hypothetical protein